MLERGWDAVRFGLSAGEFFFQVHVLAGEPERTGAALFKPLRQVIESVNETFKGQLNLEQHQAAHPSASSPASCSASSH